MNLLKVYNSKLKSVLNNMDHIVIVILSTFAAHLAALIFFLTLKIPVMVINPRSDLMKYGYGGFAG